MLFVANYRGNHRDGQNEKTDGRYTKRLNPDDRGSLFDGRKYSRYVPSGRCVLNVSFMDTSDNACARVGNDYRL